MSAFQGPFSTKLDNTAPGGVVEIGLLLPADWAAALVDLSRRRQQSVAQILRSLINTALTAEESLSN
jgi:hypothetical protein